MTFAIYDAASDGNQLWTETQPSVSVTDGLFNVLLGNVNPINISDLTGNSYLGIKVGADAEMMPRQQIVSVAYALRAETAVIANNADTLDGVDSACFSLAGHNHNPDYVNVTGDTMTGQLNLPANGLVAGGTQLVLTGGNVGIGTTPAQTINSMFKAPFTPAPAPAAAPAYLVKTPIAAMWASLVLATQVLVVIAAVATACSAKAAAASAYAATAAVAAAMACTDPTPTVPACSATAAMAMACRALVVAATA